MDYNDTIIDKKKPNFLNNLAPVSKMGSAASGFGSFDSGSSIPVGKMGSASNSSGSTSSYFGSSATAALGVDNSVSMSSAFDFGSSAPVPVSGQKRKNIDPTNKILVEKQKKNR